jgi:ABC-type lipoprotein export system ATPase subunit
MAELESVIENRLIHQLCSGESQWTYRPDIRTEEDLWNNFKYILEQNNKAKLDDIPLSESEFAKVKNDLSHSSFYDAGKWIVGENGKVYVHVQRGNETLHLVVMNNEHVAGGSSVYEVINQYQAFKDDNDVNARDRRFDVTLLINGIPLIHIELKNKEHSYMDGYRQIKKYIAEGKFHGIFSNVQMFVVSNAVDTKYFSAARDTELNKKFLTGWIDRENMPICDYIDFAEAVLKIPQAHEMVTKYTVLDNDKKKLLILRPYQIHAIEAMREASKAGKSGYIWHTTGSGKTMLLRIISGLVFPTSGSIIINGKTLHKEISFPDHMGLIIENMELQPQLTAFENLEELNKINHYATTSDIQDALRKINLQSNEKVKKFSLGMKQKLNIAQAIFENPRLLLLDEPTNALDSDAIEHLKAILEDLKKKNCCIIIATHDHQNITSLCDRILEMKEGNLYDKN